MSSSKGCSFCIRYGLPILPVRPALMEQTDVLPALPASINMPTPTQGETAYTARLLRDGYLYVYDEMIKGWLDYYVTAEGYYYPLPTKGLVSPDIADGKITPCIDQPIELAQASLITLPVMPAGQKNGLFWLSWSGAQWTDATRKKHEDADYRAQHMQRFDMDAWLHRKSAENVVALSTLTHCVAEYSPKANTSTVKNWSLAPWKRAKPLAANHIILAAEALYAGQGAIMVLQDPVAVAQDIAWLANYRINQHFYENQAYTRGLALSNALDVLKESISAQYRRDRVSGDLAGETYLEYGIDAYHGTVVAPDLAASALMKEANLQSLDPWVEKKWQENYGKYYDEGKQRAFTEQFNQALAEYDQQVMVPMMKMYLAWLEGNCMAQYFQHNFDSTNADSGMLYTQAATDCIDGVQDKLLVSQYFQARLSASNTDKKHFLFRATVLNNDLFAKEIASNINVTGDINALPWDKLADAFTLIFDQKIAAAQLVLLKFQNALSGTLYSLVEKVINTKPADALVAFAIASNKKIQVITATASRKDFITAVVHELAQKFAVSGQMNINQLRHYVTIELRHLEAQGIKLSGTQVNKFAILADIRETSAIPNSTGAARAAAIAQTLRSAEEVKATLFPHSFKNQLAQLQGMPAQSLSTSAVKSLPFAGVVLSAAIQSYALVHAGLPKEFAVEKTSRFAANITMAVGATADATERLLNDFKSIRLKAHIRAGLGGRVQRFISSSLTFAKQWIGGPAAIVYAVLDASQAFSEFSKGHSNIGIAYLSSALGGGLLGFATTFMIILPPVGVAIAIMLFFGAAIYLALAIKDDVQLWLMSCLWRKIPEGEKQVPPIWPTSKMEMEALHNALVSGAE